MFYDRQGRFIQTQDEHGNILMEPMRQLSAFFSDESYKRVARTEVSNCVVSTVWLGIDHNFGDGPPLIFETMIFGEGNNAPYEDWCWRYSTLEEAEVAHEAIVAALREGREPAWSGQ
jgi:hypothetical protein